MNDTDISTGLFWTGNQALEIGLIDDVASVYDVNEKYFSDVDILNYNRKESLLDNLLGKTLNKLLNINSNTLKY